MLAGRLFSNVCSKGTILFPFYLAYHHFLQQASRIYSQLHHIEEFPSITEARSHCFISSLICARGFVVKTRFSNHNLIKCSLIFWAKKLQDSATMNLQLIIGLAVHDARNPLSSFTHLQHTADLPGVTCTSFTSHVYV